MKRILKCLSAPSFLTIVFITFPFFTAWQINHGSLVREIVGPPFKNRRLEKKSLVVRLFNFYWLRIVSIFFPGIWEGIIVLYFLFFSPLVTIACLSPCAGKWLLLSTRKARDNRKQRAGVPRSCREDEGVATTLWSVKSGGEGIADNNIADGSCYGEIREDFFEFYTRGGCKGSGVRMSLPWQPILFMR